MQEILDFLKTDNFLIIICILNVILFIGFIITLIKLSKNNKMNKQFFEKLGDGKDLKENLEIYMDRVINVENQNQEILNYCKNLDFNLKKCIQKIGMVRYSAFKDTGSDLSFALALLDENNDGVVLNGIYSREMSNIYAKPVVKGKSTYTISEEEKEAINKAINTDGFFKIDI